MKQISEKANSEPFEGFPANADKSILNNRLNGIKIDNGLVKHAANADNNLKIFVPASHSGFAAVKSLGISQIDFADNATEVGMFVSPSNVNFENNSSPSDVTSVQICMSELLLCCL